VNNYLLFFFFAVISRWSHPKGRQVMQSVGIEAQRAGQGRAEKGSVWDCTCRMPAEFSMRASTSLTVLPDTHRGFTAALQSVYVSIFSVIQKSVLKDRVISPNLIQPKFPG
jgi:hypothetical protein